MPRSEATHRSRIPRARGARHGVLFAVAVGAALPAVAFADPTSVVNELRAAGCARVPATSAPARRHSALDAAARELASGAKLGDALARVGYPAAKSAAYHVRGGTDDAAMRGALVPRYCQGVNDPALVEIGVHRAGNETWVVMAGRTETPFTELRDPAAVARRVLDLVNEARGAARRCGRNRFEPAPPLALSTALTAAASLHALDMAEHGKLTHDGSDGSDSSERITRAGFAWQISGENVASGQTSAEAVVAAWLDSPGHCATLMDARFTETGVAFALAPNQNPAVYWAQEFAAPRVAPP